MKIRIVFILVFIIPPPSPLSGPGDKVSRVLPALRRRAGQRGDRAVRRGRGGDFYLNPDVAWEITDRIKWYTGFWSKWTFYDELDSEGNPKDFTSLLAKTNLTFKPLDKLKIITSFQKTSCVSRWESRAQSLSGLIMSSD